MTDDMTIQLDSETYVLRPDGDGVQVGRRVDGDPDDGIAWLDTVDPSLFPDAAREAIDRGDTSDEALLTALRGVVQAEVERGG
jgi:hypothetical protein